LSCVCFKSYRQDGWFFSRESLNCHEINSG
jgi:hypothetical protein